MPRSHKGVKFSTLHKFGKRRRKKKTPWKEVMAISTETDMSQTQSQSEPDGASIGTGRDSTSSQFPGSSQENPLSLLASTSRKEVSSSKAAPSPKRRRRKDLEGDAPTNITKRKREEKDDKPLKPRTHTNFIIDLSCLQSLTSKLKCPRCRKANVTLCEGGPDSRDGLSCLLEVVCADCGVLSKTQTSLALGKTGTTDSGSESKKLIVSAAVATGLDYSQTSNFFAMMDMPQPMSQDTWNLLNSQLHADADAKQAT